MQFQSLCWEDALEKEMATSSSILPEKSHGQRSLMGYAVHGFTKSRPGLGYEAQNKVSKEPEVWGERVRDALIGFSLFSSLGPVQLFCDPLDCQALLSMEFSMQAYWNG